MKNSVKIAVLLLVLALFLAVGCAKSETGDDLLGPGEENGDEVIGEDNGDSRKEEPGKDSVSSGDDKAGSGNGDSVADDPEGEVGQDSGIYLGQADSHSIEIHISGVPREMGEEVFQLSGKVQKEFASYGFETDDQVKFTYVLWEQDGVTVKTIIAIEKIKN